MGEWWQIPEGRDATQSQADKVDNRKRIQRQPVIWIHDGRRPEPLSPAELRSLRARLNSEPSAELQMGLRWALASFVAYPVGLRNDVAKLRRVRLAAEELRHALSGLGVSERAFS